MAATRLIALHVNKGKTVAQCLNERLDYSQNPVKTEKGELISSYACDPETAAMEFLLSKRQYQQVTGQEYKGNIIAYQIRQSFKPGEITPEEANRLGYELAMRFTKGNHAFTVSTHTDRAHIHNHIIFNSTTLDCIRKFKNFFFSGIALQAQVGRVQELARSSCCNCVDGNCLLLDDGEPQACVQLICTRAIYCRYFQTAVLPADKALYREITGQNANGQRNQPGPIF